jgi:hypothetical protein
MGADYYAIVTMRAQPNPQVIADATFCSVFQIGTSGYYSRYGLFKKNKVPTWVSEKVFPKWVL